MHCRVFSWLQSCCITDTPTRKHVLSFPHHRNPNTIVSFPAIDFFELTVLSPLQTYLPMKSFTTFLTLMHHCIHLKIRFAFQVSNCGALPSVNTLSPVLNTFQLHPCSGHNSEGSMIEPVQMPGTIPPQSVLISSLIATGIP